MCGLTLYRISAGEFQVSSFTLPWIRLHLFALFERPHYTILCGALHLTVLRERIDIDFIFFRQVCRLYRGA